MPRLPARNVRSGGAALALRLQQLWPLRATLHDSTGLPFDRQRTSLKAFAMCGKCRAEYARPNDRRLRAEGNCCPKCGPQLTLLDADGKLLAGDVIAQALTLLRDGKIVAIKGPGGFHLACDARNPAAVARMREHKGASGQSLPGDVCRSPFGYSLCPVPC